MPDDRYTCLICGKSYGRMHDMKRHQNMAHSDEMSQRSRSGSESEESERESRGKDDEGSDAEMSSDDLEDNSVYLEWYDQALEASQLSRNEKYEKYLNDDMPEGRAREKAYAKTLRAIKKNIFLPFLGCFSLKSREVLISIHSLKIFVPHYSEIRMVQTTRDRALTLEKK